jgi:Fe-S-cluster containining protein
MSAPVPTRRKEEIWLACAAKTCCHTAVVVPTGRDVWRIARALDAPPWSFLRYFPTPVPRGDAFALAAVGPRYRLVLGKAPSRRRTPPCVFLMRTRRGQHRCALGPLRPMACHAFPSEVVGGALCVRNDGGCTCRTWTLADLDVAEETAAVIAREVEAEEYRAVVAAWNARVAARSVGDGVGDTARDGAGDAALSFFDYCTYLLETYDALAAGSGPTGAER